MWTKAQVRGYQSALAEAQKHKPAIDKLLKMAQYNPALLERVQQLADMREHLENTATAALAADSDGE